MPISIVCSNCDKSLKVADTAAGKKIRCPECKGVLAVPEAEEEDEAPVKKKAAAADDEDDDGYGMDQERDEEDEELRRKKKRKQKREEQEERKRRRRAAKPHRGTTVLIYGILSIVCSCIPIVAWYLGWTAINMAGEDLEAMAARRMDSSGQGATQAGKICGIIGAILGLVALIVGVGSTLAAKR